MIYRELCDWFIDFYDVNNSFPVKESLFCLKISKSACSDLFGYVSELWSSSYFELINVLKVLQFVCFSNVSSGFGYDYELSEYSFTYSFTYPVENCCCYLKNDLTFLHFCDIDSLSSEMKTLSYLSFF